ncbi:MAG: hypothetical protein AAGG68_05035 [Bacteroidota bacterium]
MNDSDLKLKIFRLIDRQEETALHEIYRFILNSFTKEKKIEEPLEVEDELEMSYKMMAEDEEREREAEIILMGN